MLFNHDNIYHHQPSRSSSKSQFCLACEVHNIATNEKDEEGNDSNRKRTRANWIEKCAILVARVSHLTSVLHNEWYVPLSCSGNSLIWSVIPAMAVSASCNSISRTTVVMLDRYAWMSNNLIGSLISPSNHADHRHLCVPIALTVLAARWAVCCTTIRYPDESSQTSAISPSVFACAENVCTWDCSIILSMLLCCYRIIFCFVFLSIYDNLLRFFGI